MKTTAPSKVPVASTVPSSQPGTSTEPTKVPDASSNPSTSSDPNTSAEPSATPAAKLTEISELKATTAATLVATFTEATPDDTTVEVTKGSAAVDGKVSWNEARTEVAFAATANLTAGTYKLTAKSGETSVSKEVEVKDEYAAEIKITSKDALTNKDKSEAYIYYDVLNQYGESIRTSTTINWTVSSCDSFTVNKSNGLITAKKKAGEVFNYGTVIYLTGVHVKSGLSVTASVTVGMEQAINSLEFAGFLCKDDKTKILENLPLDFAKGKYVLLYQTFDQNGNPLEAAADNISESRITFVTDNVMMIKSEFTDDAVYTIDAKEYSSVTLEPGMYVDRGGEVNITAISNTTGNKTVKNFKIGAKALLQSLALDTPADTIADGDTWVKLPYTAKDTDGNTVTNYETIVRSTHSLTITSSEGELVIKEENDGTAGIYWSDNTTKYNAYDASIWKESSSRDEVDRNISLVTTVIGGESNNMLLPVSDARRPVAIKNVTMASETGNNEGIMNGVTASILLTGTYQGNKIEYLDQFGKDLDGGKAAAFFDATKAGTQDGTYYDGKQYGVRVDTKANHLGLRDGGKVYQGNITLTAAASSTTQADSDTVKYSIVKLTASDADLAALAIDVKDSMVSWDDVSKIKSVSYSIVPTDIVSDFSISDIAKQEITTTESAKANGMDVADIKDVVSGSDITINNASGFSVMANYKGMSLKLPTSSFRAADGVGGAASGSAISITANWDGSPMLCKILANDNGLKWNELYDENSARLTRKDAVKPLVIEVLPSTGAGIKATVKKSVSFSDAEPVLTTIKFAAGAYTSAATIGVTNTTLNSVPAAADEWQHNNALSVVAFDQYGRAMGSMNWGTGLVEGAPVLEFNISDVKENTDEFAHLPSSFTVSGNGSSSISVTGAEIKDSFKLTATDPVTGVSADVTVTVQADSNAKISTTQANNTDENFRKTKLNFDR